MKNITRLQAFELIDHAANENRIYHYNGGQAYIRVSMDSNVLMIIDHTTTMSEISVHDGTEYFNSYKNNNIEHSRRLREQGPLVQWYLNQKTNKVTV